MSDGEHTPPKDFGAFRNRLRKRFESLSPHLQRIAEYAVGQPNRLALQSVAETASDARVQPSTLVRFAKLFGFSGFSDMRLLFRRRLFEAEDAIRTRVRESRRKMHAASGEEPSEILDALADASALAIERCAADVDAEALSEAVRLMLAADAIHVLGRDRAQPVAACLVHGLIGLRRRCVVLDAVAGTAAQRVEAMRPADLLIAVAHEAGSQSVIDAMASARSRDVPVIAITDSVLGPHTHHASVNIVIHDAGIDGVVPMAPHIVLAQSLIIALGFSLTADTRARNDGTETG